MKLQIELNLQNQTETTNCIKIIKLNWRGKLNSNYQPTLGSGGPGQAKHIYICACMFGWAGAGEYLLFNI